MTPSTPDSDDKTPIARPASPTAHKALAQFDRFGRKRHRITLAGLGELTLFAVLGSFVLGRAILFVIGVVGAIAVLAFLAMAALSTHARRTFQHHVDIGDIVLINDNLIQVWDELLAEEGIDLTETERDAELCRLTLAEADLEHDLAQRSALINDSVPDDERLIYEARIRARLLDEIDRLNAERAARERLDRLITPSSAPDWVPSDAVLQQMAILRQRRTDQHGLSESPRTDDPGDDG